MYTVQHNQHVTCSVGKYFEKLFSNPGNWSAQSEIMGNDDGKQDSMTQVCTTSLGKQSLSHTDSPQRSKCC